MGEREGSTKKKVLMCFLILTGLNMLFIENYSKGKCKSHYSKAK